MRRVSLQLFDDACIRRHNEPQASLLCDWQSDAKLLLSGKLVDANLEPTVRSIVDSHRCRRPAGRSPAAI